MNFFPRSSFFQSNASSDFRTIFPSLHVFWMFILFAFSAKFIFLYLFNFFSMLSLVRLGCPLSVWFSKFCASSLFWSSLWLLLHQSGAFVFPFFVFVWFCFVLLLFFLFLNGDFLYLRRSSRAFSEFINYLLSPWAKALTYFWGLTAIAWNFIFSQPLIPFLSHDLFLVFIYILPLFFWAVHFTHDHFHFTLLYFYFTWLTGFSIRSSPHLISL